MIPEGGRSGSGAHGSWTGVMRTSGNTPRTKFAEILF
jgi:hypothetical protein